MPSRCPVSCAPRASKLLTASPLCEYIFMPWLFYTHAIFQSPITVPQVPGKYDCPGSGKQDLANKISSSLWVRHSNQDDRGSCSRSERKMQPYKDRAFQAVPHQDSKRICVIRCTTALVLNAHWSMGRWGADRRRKTLCNLFFISQWLWIRYLMKQ